MIFERDAEAKVDFLLGPIPRQTVVICKGNLSCASSDAKEGGAYGNDVDFAGIDQEALCGTRLGEAVNGPDCDVLLWLAVGNPIAPISSGGKFDNRRLKQQRSERIFRSDEIMIRTPAKELKAFQYSS